MKLPAPDCITPELLEIARKTIEDHLIEMRDMRVAVVRNNGLVIKEADGDTSHIIRMGPEEAVMLGYRAMYEHLQRELTNIAPEEAAIAAEEGGYDWGGKR